jgi:hypothetical protein
MSAGSFCPSPSRVTTQWDRAALTPAQVAVLWPQLLRRRTDLSRGNRARACDSRDGVSSLLPSST